MLNGENGESSQWSRRMNKVSGWLSGIALAGVTGSTLGSLANYLHADTTIMIDGAMVACLGVAVAVDELFPSQRTLVTTVSANEDGRQQG